MRQKRTIKERISICKQLAQHFDIIPRLGESVSFMKYDYDDEYLITMMLEGSKYFFTVEVVDITNTEYKNMTIKNGRLFIKEDFNLDYTSVSGTSNLYFRRL